MTEIPPPPSMPPAMPPAGPPMGAPYGAAPGKGKAIAALVLGIVSIALCLYWFISIPAGIVAVVLGVLSRKQGIGAGMSLAGIITGALGALFGVIILILGLTGGGIESYCDDNPDSAICTSQ